LKNPWIFHKEFYNFVDSFIICLPTWTKIQGKLECVGFFMEWKIHQFVSFLGLSIGISGEISVVRLGLECF